MNTHSDLFTSASIGGVEVPNRIVMPAMTTRLADEEGYVTADTLAYFSARAEGGVGLVTVEMASPERAGRHRFRELGIYDDRFLPGLRDLTDALHAAGARVSIQLGHAGGHTRRDICGEDPVAPSAIPHYVFERTGATVIPQAMSLERIAATIASYVAAARRAKTAGFDCIEVHAAHGYLLSQFLCPAENRRQDAYGGALEGRARLSLEVLRAIKHEVTGIAVIFRMNANDYFPDGLEWADAFQLAQLAVEAGADALHVTAGHYRSLPSAHMMTPPMNCVDGIFLDYAARIKAVVKVPVIAVGRLGDPALAAAAIRDGKADFIALGRTLIADPDWARKVRAGIAPRRCLSCNTCVDGMRSGDRLGCVVNPRAARERDHLVGPAAPRAQRIAVIGAGPAGLSYAEQAATHNDVTVFERSQRAGGALRHAGSAPQFQGVEAVQQPLDVFIDELERACRQKNVHFRYGCGVTAISDIATDFDHIIIATGATYRLGSTVAIYGFLKTSWCRSRFFRWMFGLSFVRDIFYYRLRKSVRPSIAGVDAARVTLIGDALTPGKTREAIATAFAAAKCV